MKKKIEHALTIFKKLEDAEELIKVKYELAQKNIELFRTSLFDILGIKYDTLVHLHIYEWRDDRVSAFAVEREADLYIINVSITTYGNEGPIIFPVLRKKKKGVGKVWFSPHQSWDMSIDGEIILSHKEESIIIPGKYTEEKLNEIRLVLADRQGF